MASVVSSVATGEIFSVSLSTVVASASFGEISSPLAAIVVTSSAFLPEISSSLAAVVVTSSASFGAISSSLAAIVVTSSATFGEMLSPVAAIVVISDSSAFLSSCVVTSTGCSVDLSSPSGASLPSTWSLTVVASSSTPDENISSFPDAEVVVTSCSSSSLIVVDSCLSSDFGKGTGISVPDRLVVVSVSSKAAVVATLLSSD